MKNFSKEFRILLFTVTSFFAYTLVFADADSNVAQVINYIKWLIGVLAGLVTVGSVGTLLWGLWERNNGNPKGDDRIKNSLWTILWCSVAWLLLGALVLAGGKFGTGIQGIEKGWQ
jgi:hypothetical protein